MGIIITRARLRRVSGKSYAVNRVRFLYICISVSQPIGINEINQGPCYMLKALSLKSGNLIWIWVLLINLLVNHCEIFFLSFYGSILTSRDFP